MLPAVKRAFVSLKYAKKPPIAASPTAAHGTAIPRAGCAVDVAVTASASGISVTAIYACDFTAPAGAELRPRHEARRRSST
jgi:hypothetical protein